jgi:tRNA threonylcarbamoyladenosine biosynthesis protein TsaB
VTNTLTLALETSSARGGVALARGSLPPLVRTLETASGHAGELFPAIRDLLHDAGARLADVTLLAFSHGPGSFTGLRLAATIARMLQSSIGCTVVAVPTLEVIATNALAHPDRPSPLAVILDARRGQVFGALFERRNDELETARPAGMFDAASWLAGLPRPFWILGDGIPKHADAVAASGGTVLDETYWPPRAETVLRLGQRLAAGGHTCSPAEIVPAYFRPPECEEVYETRRAQARRRRGQ